MADAFEGLFVTADLWIVLALMLVVAGITGSMPRSVAAAGLKAPAGSACARPDRVACRFHRRRCDPDSTVQIVAKPLSLAA
jgi:hypothetical protein